MNAQNVDKAPPLPTNESGLEETREYFEYLFENRQPIRVRDVISIWGARARSARITSIIAKDLEKIGFSVTPPVDTGTLNTLLTIRRTEASSSGDDSPEIADPHMLTLAVFPTAISGLQENADEDSRPLMTATASQSISPVLVDMLRHDYSQVPIVEEENKDVLLGVFSWKSYASAILLGKQVVTTGDALEAAVTADLHSDLFANAARIGGEGYCFVTFRGRLAGIITASDLISSLEELAIPFLAVGRAEQELKRVAKLMDMDTPLKIEKMMFGQLQDLYKNKWGKLPWKIDKSDFDAWVNSTRKLRNSVSHHDQPAGNIHELVAQVHRMTQWLSTVNDPSAAYDETAGMEKGS